jgi:hypothetical protein
MTVDLPRPLPQHTAMCKAAEEAESASRKEIEANTSSSSDDDDDDEVKRTEKPLLIKPSTKTKQATVIVRAAVTTTKTRPNCCHQMGKI